MISTFYKVAFGYLHKNAEDAKMQPLDFRPE